VTEHFKGMWLEDVWLMMLALDLPAVFQPRPACASEADEAGRYSEPSCLRMSTQFGPTVLLLCGGEWSGRAVEKLA